MSGRRNDYIVEYKGLQSGTYEIDYQLDKNFFSLFDEPEFQDGKLNAKIKMSVFSYGLEFVFDILGTVKAECDRCLELFDLPINAHYDMKVRFSDKTTDPEEADEEITLSTEEHEIDLKQHIYEFVVLSAPARRVHPSDGCNPEILKAISGGDEQEETTEAQTDPRWDKLKDLLNIND